MTPSHDPKDAPRVDGSGSVPASRGLSRKGSLRASKGLSQGSKGLQARTGLARGSKSLSASKGLSSKSGGLSKGTKPLAARKPLSAGSKPLSTRAPLTSKGGTLATRSTLDRGKSTLRTYAPLTTRATLRQAATSGLTAKATPLNRSPLIGGGSLRPGQGLGGSAGFSGSSALSGGKGWDAPRKGIKSKVKNKSAAEVSTRKIVAQRSAGICEVCACRPATDMAHRRARSAGGPWAPSNILHACSQCHHHNHDNPQPAYEAGWHVLGGITDPKDVPVLLAFSPSRKVLVLLDDLGGRNPVL